MPKSKRDKKISLTKTDKKGLALKQKIVEDVRNCVEKFSSIYVFTYRNMRNELMKDVREQWKPSRFFFGKNKVIGVGLGRNKEEEVADDLHKLSRCLKGQCALLFTDSPKDEVIEWFESYSCEDFARSGCVVDKTVTLPEGALKQFPHSMEPYLRQLGMPTKLERGVVTLIKEFEVCKEGGVLTPEQAKILEFLGHRLAVFKLDLRAAWIKGSGFERLDGKSEDNDENMNEDEDN
ncbi:mRNA turnover protein 4 homolog [Tribolium castaneum]|uniref:Ribosome assembly factor mrt4 n=1 Tax=Tribolium castaneum TaxID=7070 RepID=D6X3W1_TRICA|nr:PREDICTED: mRNA turnover protein 4 homolog [Tribolium castaneum]EEZ97361.1 mRNA turnover protein 4 homolog-like Protein [Tribolium castaneum]|eukprot:XP_967054.1 PREDICTED: mRNA turnover protein 4 homolog [Tribolium castaneum]